MSGILRAAAAAPAAPRFWPLAIGLALVVCSARIACVAYGMPELPMLDEWSAIDGIAIAHAAGAFDARYFLAPHNEHLLVWTKLLDWLLLRACDNQFDARPLGMLLAAATGTGASLLLAAAARRLDGGRAAFLVAGVALVALPYAWENLTENWNNSHALLVAGAFATLHVALHGRSAAAALPMLLAAVFSALAMGSGAVAPTLGIALVAWRWRRGDLRAPAAVALVLAQAVAVLLAVALLFGRTYPGPRPPLDIPLACLQFALLACAFAPAAGLGWRVVRSGGDARGAPARRDDVLAAALALWGALHIGAMIAFRAEFRIWLPISRYMDTIAFAALANLYCALRLAQAGVGARLQAAIRSGAAAFAALALLAAPLPLGFLAWQAERFERAQQLVRDVVQRGDADAIDRAGAGVLPFPDRGYLRAHLSDARVQRILGDRFGTRPQAAPAIAASRAVEDWLGAHARALALFAVLAGGGFVAAALRQRPAAAAP